MSILNNAGHDPAQQPPAPRMRWQDYLLAAVTDLRNSDRSPGEEKIYDILRLIVERTTP